MNCLEIAHNSDVELSTGVDLQNTSGVFCPEIISSYSNGTLFLADGLPNSRIERIVLRELASVMPRDVIDNLNPFQLAVVKESRINEYIRHWRGHCKCRLCRQIQHFLTKRFHSHNLHRLAEQEIQKLLFNAPVGVLFKPAL